MLEKVNSFYNDQINKIKSKNKQEIVKINDITYYPQTQKFLESLLNSYHITNDDAKIFVKKFVTQERQDIRILKDEKCIFIIQMLMCQSQRGRKDDFYEILLLNGLRIHSNLLHTLFKYYVKQNVQQQALHELPKLHAYNVHQNITNWTKYVAKDITDKTFNHAKVQKNADLFVILVFSQRQRLQQSMKRFQSKYYELEKDFKTQTQTQQNLDLQMSQQNKIETDEYLNKMIKLIKVYNHIDSYQIKKQNKLTLVNGQNLTSIIKDFYMILDEESIMKLYTYFFKEIKFDYSILFNETIFTRKIQKMMQIKYTKSVDYFKKFIYKLFDKYLKETQNYEFKLRFKNFSNNTQHKFKLSVAYYFYFLFIHNQNNIY